MPTLQISSNIEIAEPEQFIRAASKLVAEMLGKPEMYVMIIIRPCCVIYR